MRTKLLVGLCAILFLIASAEGVLLVRAHWEQKKLASRDPFRVMRSIHLADPLESFWGRGFRDKFFGDFDNDSFFKHFGKGFSEAFSFEAPKWEERGKEMRMVLDIKGHDQGDYSVDVSGEQITLTGKDKNSRKEDGLTRESHWSNTQSFPLPPDVDPKDFRVERTRDKFMVIFKKRNTATSST